MTCFATSDHFVLYVSFDACQFSIPRNSVPTAACGSNLYAVAFLQYNRRLQWETDPAGLSLQGLIQCDFCQRSGFASKQSLGREPSSLSENSNSHSVRQGLVGSDYS